MPLESRVLDDPIGEEDAAMDDAMVLLKTILDELGATLLDAAAEETCGTGQSRS